MNSDLIISTTKLTGASALFLGSMVAAEAAPIDPGLAKLLESAVFAGFAFYLLHYSIPAIVAKHSEAVTTLATEHRETVKNIVDGHKEEVSSIRQEKSQMATLIEKALDTVSEAHTALRDKTT